MRFTSSAQNWPSRLKAEAVRSSCAANRNAPPLRLPFSSVHDGPWAVAVALALDILEMESRLRRLVKHGHGRPAELDGDVIGGPGIPGDRPVARDRDRLDEIGQFDRPVRTPQDAEINPVNLDPRRPEVAAGDLERTDIQPDFGGLEPGIAEVLRRADLEIREAKTAQQPDGQTLRG